MYIWYQTVVEMRVFKVTSIGGKNAMNGLGAGCVQQWIRSAEQPGEHRYENRNNNNNGVKTCK